MTDIAKQDPRAAELSAMVGEQSRDRTLSIMREIMRSEGLASCGRGSVLSAVHTIAGWGLDPAPSLGQAYVVPFKGQATPILGYRGMITLLARCGITVTAAILRNDDIDQARWSAHYDGAWRVRWRPSPFGDDSSPVLGAFAVFAAGDHVVHVEQIRSDDQHVRKLESSARPGSPWRNDRLAMLRKTAIRRGFSQLPLDTPQIVRLAEIVKADAEIEHQHTVTQVETITQALDVIAGEVAGDEGAAEG